MTRGQAEYEDYLRECEAMKREPEFFICPKCQHPLKTSDAECPQCAS